MESRVQKVRSSDVELDEEEFNIHEELEDSDPEDEEVQGSTPLITACRKSMTEVVQRLMKSEVDMTLCDSRQQTALHVSPPELQGKVLGWMSRPHLPPQTQLLQAAWQGDLHSLQSLLVQTDKVDVNIPNRDGATAVMLAVRDIDLFEGMAMPLPWEHRPVQVVKKLLGLSADLQVRDHCGRSALNYAASINSPLKDEIIRMMAEALSRTDAATDNYACQDLDSEFEDSDIDLDLESVYSQRSTAASPTWTPTNQHSSGLHNHTEEVPDSAGCPPPSDHHKSLSQDKGIPLCFENAMETLSDIRQAYQDAGRGSRGGVSLPSLGRNSRRWTLDPDPSSGLQSTRTSCQPVPPRHRQRTRSVAAASSSSPGRMFVAEPSQLSQSAPSIMEPLLSSNTMMQARAHIQSRLGAQDTATEQKQFSQRLLPTPHPRTPRLLAPLDSRLRDITPLPGLKHPIPLKPISRSSLCSRARPKRGGLSRGSSRLGPLTTKGGSEDSGSSSSHSSMDLEDEDDGKDEGVSGGVHLKFVGDLLLQHSNNVSSSVTDLVGNTRGCLKVPPRTRHFSQIHRSTHDLNEEPYNHSNDPIRTVKYITYHCEDKVNHKSDTKDHVDSHTFTKCQNEQQGNTLNLTKVTISNKMPITSKPQEERTKAGYSTDLQTEVCNGTTAKKDQSHGIAERSSRNDLQQTKQTEKTSKNWIYEKTLGDDLIPCTEDQKLDLQTADNRNVDAGGDTKMSKVLKSVQNKERKATKNCEAEADIQTNHQSFSRLPNKDRISSNRIKIKENLKTLSTQAEVKTRKSHELKINGETVTKVKSKLKCVKGTAIPSPRKKITDPAHSRRGTPDKSNINKAQQHLPETEPKSTRQLKRPSLEGSSRSRSVLDFITYKDMFQQIQSGDKGPAIYEMFAGPIYENLRVSSSCEKVKDRQVRSAPPRKTHKVKQRPMKQAQSKQRRSLADSTEDSPKSKAKLSTPRVKPQVTSVPKRGTEKIKQILDGHSGSELHALRDAGGCHNSSEETAGDHMLPPIEENLSKYGSETLNSDNKTLTTPATFSHTGYGYPQEKDGNSSTGLQNLPISESSQSPQHLKINTWTSSSSNNHTIVSPVYQRFLDGVGDGPLTDDLLQCLAEELISLDERDVSTGPGPDPSEKECDGESNPLMVNKTENVALLGSGLVVDDNISWTKGEVLGRGAYGTVYCGLTSRGGLIAVKQVNLDASDPDAAKREYSRLQGEVDLLKTLRHNNIVGFLGTSLHRHVVSIFMEYIPGGSIASILHRFGPLPERVLALYTHQILEGVTFLHLNRVIHRDLKGNNVMLMPTGVIKLIDFGCARRLSCLNHTASNSGDLLKSVHGTPYWMAPEVINETGYGRKSDVWSVGCTVFEMATGKPPLAHMDKMAALFYIGAQRGMMPSLPDGFSESAKDFVKICLTSNQRQRPSAEKLLKHPFIPQNETGENSWETQKRNCCGHQEGLCG